jgi:leader peptidase (prepilin peptidase)/N-methyltransferase
MEWTMLPTYGYLAVLSALLVISDIRHQVLPNILTMTAYPILLGLLTIPATVNSEWTAWFSGLLGSGVTFSVFFALALIAPSGLGMGDVKLAGALAIPLAWISWSSLLWAMAGAFIASAVVGLVMLAMHRANRHTLIPLGPFLLACTWLVIALT